MNGERRDRGAAAGRAPVLWLRGVLIGVVAGIVVLFMVVKISPLANVPKWDETLYVYDAQRLLSGQVPYRDFFNFTPPGTFFLQAAWYALWGGRASLTLGRYLAGLVALLGFLSLARTLRRSGWDRPWAVLWAALFPLALYGFWPVPSHHWFASLFFFLSFEAFDFEKERVKEARGWVWCGAMVAGTFLCLQTQAVILAVFWGTLWLLVPEKRLVRAGWTTAGAASVALPAAVWFGFHGALGAFFRDVVLWPLANYGRAGGPNAVRFLGDLPDRIGALWRGVPDSAAWRWIPFSTAAFLLYAGLCCAGALLLALALRTLLLSVKRRSLGSPLEAAAMAATLVALALYSAGKTDWLHLVYLLGPVGLTWLVQPALRRLSLSTRRIVQCGLVGLFLCAAIFQLGFPLFHRVARWELADADRPVREAPINRFLRAQPWLEADDTLVALPEGGQVYLYVRPAAIGYTLLTPLSDRYNTLEDHRVAARQMEEKKPRCVVVTVDTERAYLDQRSPVGVTIKREFKRMGTVGNAALYVRRPVR